MSRASDLLYTEPHSRQDFVNKLSIMAGAISLLALTLKRLGEGGGQFDSPPRGFSKNVSYKERVKPWFFLLLILL